MNHFMSVMTGTVFQMFFGMLWYGPLNGKLFWELAFKSATPPPDTNLSLCYGVAAVASFGMNNVLKLMVDACALDTLVAGCVVGALFWSFSFLIQVPHVFFEHRSLPLMILHELGHFIILTFLCAYYVYTSKVFG
eukprot:g8087.t1